MSVLPDSRSCRANSRHAHLALPISRLRAARSARYEREVIRFAGYAALFGQRDAARDCIHPGAFSATLAQRRDPLPLYWQHDPRQRIGWVDHVAEDARGLRVVGAIDRPASRAAALLAARGVSGLSFGYRATRARHGPHGRELLAVDLIEISLVTHPLQYGARVHFTVP